MISEFKFYRVRVRVILTLCQFFQNFGRQIYFSFIFLPFWTDENTLTSDMLYINRIREKFAVRISQNPKMSNL